MNSGYEILNEMVKERMGGKEVETSSIIILSSFTERGGKYRSVGLGWIL